MFEILKALLAIARTPATRLAVLTWDVYALPGGDVRLRAEVPVTEDDQLFVEQMRQMLAPVDSYARGRHLTYSGDTGRMTALLPDERRGHGSRVGQRV